ncbi:HalOD1 output domain-containing protein [Natronolimnobius baerhuensis]|uniref:Halobacterial output domain-containing protein n=1 Tax=Natronolimnobius baerhuensis TaxID=253108 RepID=A0A202E568_9EURY|nr:HalOD1 output domain-containing protein [Natronolimnobius baerhuensis]OVE83359.1 hypothetical protein B2G88_12915 [Natronolimnobius baerhuensis]
MSGTGAREEPVVDHVQPDESVSHAILRVVADIRDQSVVELDEPLFESIDPDALEALFHDDSSGSIQFQYLELTIRVTAAGTIRVE